MKTVPLRQGSPEWLRWRRGGLGGSDADYIARLIAAEVRFWECVRTRTPPGPEFLAEVSSAR